MNAVSASPAATLYLDHPNAQAGEERRVEPRHDLEGVTGLLSYAVRARVRDLSLSGVAVETHSALRVGRSYSVRLGSEDDGIELSALVRRSVLRRTVKAPNGDVLPVYETGLSFDGVTAEVRAALRALIARTVVVKPERGLPGFLQFPGAPNGAAAEDQRCEVLQITRSGLLADTGVPGEDGEVRWVTVCLPDLSFCSRGEIANLGPRPGGKGLRLAIEFRETSPTDLERLERFLEQEVARLEEGAPEEDPGSMAEVM